MTTLMAIDLAIDSDQFGLAHRRVDGEALQRPSMRRRAPVWPWLVPSSLSPRRWSTIGSRWVRATTRRMNVKGMVFELGRHADLLGPARLAFVAVVTIGAAPAWRPRAGSCTRPGRRLIR